LAKAYTTYSRIIDDENKISGEFETAPAPSLAPPHTFTQGEEKSINWAPICSAAEQNMQYPQICMYQGCAEMDSKLWNLEIYGIDLKNGIWNVEYGMTKIIEFMELMQYMEWNSKAFLVF
jgi:hypothetical protein